ncbi:MAG TPA: XdhC family protein [Actinomycetes bacterium]|nr:XdhC family protein [Actinomycetes bacterium]
MTRASVRARTAELRAQRVPFVHAQVVMAQRPTSAKPGDEAIIYADGTIEGFVGGSCAESTVRAQSLALLDSGDPLLLRITPDVDEAADAAPAPATSAAEGRGLVSVHNPCLSGGTLEIFLEPMVPAPLLAVHGQSPIAAALVALGPHLGWEVVDWDETDDTARAAVAIVVAAHGRDEEDVLTAALAAGTPYVGLVASPTRGAAVLASLDVDETAKARVRTPAGLDIGARTPEEVALSILAEVVAARRHPSGRPIADAAAEPAPAPPPSPAVAIDPVCGMSVAAVDASLHLDHDGTRWWFCGTGCLRAFAADPSAYLQTS